jgi:hypothetical protein
MKEVGDLHSALREHEDRAQRWVVFERLAREYAL